MKCIVEELVRVELLFKELRQRNDLEGESSKDPHRDPKYLDDREWHVLGRAIDMLSDAGEVAPEFAEKIIPMHQ